MIRLPPALVCLLAGCASVDTTTGPVPAQGAPPTAVLVVLDTTRADRLGAYGGRPDISPAFDALASGGLLFEHAYSNAPWTLPTHATLFTGLPPWEHGATHATLRLEPDIPVLAEAFAAAGYRTGGFSNNPWVSDVTGLDRGFEVYIEVFRRSYASGTAINRFVDPTGLGMADAGAARSVAALDQWLGVIGDAPAFAFVNLIEAHLPYDPPEGWLGRYHDQAPLLAEVHALPTRWLGSALAGDLQQRDREAALRLYDEELAYVDHQVGAILEVLDRHGRRSDALIIVTADHGEAFGQARTEGVDLVDHQLSLRDELLHVPLVLSWPGRVEPGRRSDNVDHLQLVETLRWALSGGDAPPAGLLAPPDPMALHRASYSPPTMHEPLLRGYMGQAPAAKTLVERGFRAVRRGPYKLVVPTDGQPALYDRDTDPDELIDVAEAHPDVVEQLLTELPPPVRTGTPEVHKDVVESLRALGYVP